MRVDNAPAEKFADIDACLVQLGNIAEHRHRIVHRSTSFFGGKLIVTNTMTSKTAANAEQNIFDVPELKAMTADCEAIWLRLMWHTAIIDGVKADHGLQQYLQTRPWQYTHAPLKPPNQQRRRGAE